MAEAPASEAVLQALAVLLSEPRTRVSELRRGTAGRQCLLAPLFTRRSAVPHMSNSATRSMSRNVTLSTILSMSHSATMSMKKSVVQ